MRKKFVVITLVIVISCLLIFTACNKEEKEDRWWEDEFETTAYTPEQLMNYIGGFACGVCHPNENYDQIKDANIEWVRFDISNLPYDENGNETQGYIDFKNRAKSYADRGFKVMAVTPYPEDYLDAGIDPRLEENKLTIMKMARYYVEDLQGIVAAIQITNEMSIARFTYPLTLEEAADFIGIQAKAMYRYKKGIAICYNLGGIEGYTQLPALMEEKGYHKYIDFVGIDFYLGCFDSASGALGVGMGPVFASLAHESTGKPIMINEFGYIGYGEPKSDSEKYQMLLDLGAVGNNLTEAVNYVKENTKTFIEGENFPQSFREELETYCKLGDCKTPEEEAECYQLIGATIFNEEYSSHLYKEIDSSKVAKGYPHSPEGQANYMEDQIAVMVAQDYIVGAFVYMYHDGHRCYVCGQDGCPVETGWGLVDCDGNPKPLYYTIQHEFGVLRGLIEDDD